MDTQQRRSVLEDLLRTAVAAVDPQRLTADALSTVDRPATLIAIGKASIPMCRGAARAIGDVHGVCVSNSSDTVPEGVELLVGDHPIPGEASFEAGRRVLEVASGAQDPIIALISGGGSALCEYPIESVAPELIQEATRALLAHGASIDEFNFVRRHLSAVKNGGLSVRAPGPVDTYVISDVCGSDLSVVASGPTIHRPREPAAVLAALAKYGIDVPQTAREAITAHPDYGAPDGRVRLLADGHTATDAMVKGAAAIGVDAIAPREWLAGEVEDVLDQFLDGARPGITVAAGEPEVAVKGDGAGGRNTHAALIAATRIAGTDEVFASFATDGIDGNTRFAGAIVDGGTLDRGGDPGPSLQHSDSATYLRGSGDLLDTGDTGTNVSDIWALWR